MSTNTVFVHGFLSNQTTWDVLASHIRANAEIARHSQEYRFGYSSPSLDLNPVAQIPALEQIGQSLATFLVTAIPASRRGHPTVLIGHSQGGLVIQATLAHLIETGDFPTLLSISHCLLIATPTNGSAFLLRTRGLLQRVLGEFNPQEATLRPLNSYISDLQRRMARSVIYATAVTPTTCPIDFTAVYGTEDAVVQPQSATWVFPTTEAVPGNHFTVHRPTDSSSSLCVIMERIVRSARTHVPPDTTLLRTVSITTDNPTLLRESLALHDSEFTASQAVRQADTEHWLARYEDTFGIRLRLLAAKVDGSPRAFLMFHEDTTRNLAVIDYLVSAGQGDLDNLAVKKLLARLRQILTAVGIQNILFEVAEPLKDSPTFERDRARIRLFEKIGGRVVPQLKYLAPSMDGSFDPAGEEPSLLMVGGTGAPPTRLTWSTVRDHVAYLYGTWYRNWFSFRHASSVTAMESYLLGLRDRVLQGTPRSGSVDLPLRW